MVRFLPLSLASCAAPPPHLPSLPQAPTSPHARAPEIYDISGYKEQIARRTAARNGSLGELSGLDWQLAPRAKIFRRDAGKVDSMDSFLQIMRYNDYKNDPYSEGSPWNAICSRGDLAGSPDGCLDGKASMASLWASKTAFAVNGPTTGALYDGTLPPFKWSEFPDTPHLGLFPEYNLCVPARQGSFARFRGAVLTLPTAAPHTHSPLAVPPAATLRR